MDLLNHDIAHEFPQYLDKMHELKKADSHFAKLFAEYDEDDHAIKKYELGAAVISDEALEVLKKQRLHIKDQIYQILLKA
ncbi:MAG: DUF465 domain-containing protein [Polaromonas sp.]